MNLFTLMQTVVGDHAVLCLPVQELYWLLNSSICILCLAFLLKKKNKKKNEELLWLQTSSLALLLRFTGAFGWSRLLVNGILWVNGCAKTGVCYRVVVHVFCRIVATPGIWSQAGYFEEGFRVETVWIPAAPFVRPMRRGVTYFSILA